MGEWKMYEYNVATMVNLDFGCGCEVKTMKFDEFA